MICTFITQHTIIKNEITLAPSHYEHIRFTSKKIKGFLQHKKNVQLYPTRCINMQQGEIINEIHWDLE